MAQSSSPLINSSIAASEFKHRGDTRDIRYRPPYIYTPTNETTVVTKLITARIHIPTEDLLHMKFENTLDKYLQIKFIEELANQIGPLKYTMSKDTSPHASNPYNDVTIVETALYIEDHQ